MVTGGLSTSDGVDYYRIDGVEEMPPFLMTVVSDSDLWMFVSSSGGLTAGRIDADHALFPYATDDRIHRSVGLAGPVTTIERVVDGARELWRPFGREITADCSRSIAKSVLGDRLVFEEHHHSWGLTFRASWAPSDRFGWVREVALLDHRGHAAEYEVLDGLLDVMPAGIDATTEQTRSNLADAYKRSEVGPWGSLAVYSLESLISDRAEPAESLAATVVWSSGLPDAEIELDERAVADAVAGRPRPPAGLVTGRPGAYLLRGTVAVPASGVAAWTMVADTGLNHVAVANAVRVAQSADALDRVARDLEAGSQRLQVLLGEADGIQHTGDPVADAHHLSNLLFNSMRGGVFPAGHDVSIADLAAFVGARNRPVLDAHRSWFDRLSAQIHVDDLRQAALTAGDPDLIRLVLEYLPLTFSRRHGDPSRPWNRFSIKVRDEHGTPLLAYEGNWRDIFQNWEALLASYPAYHSHVVAKFVNASTVDGYNPYRISHDGIDWEVPDPDDPWSHIGYWGDHQIVYLLRLLESWERHEPGAIEKWFDRAVFVAANVPYAIADHQAMVQDPRNTITYDHEEAARIATREASIGADGRLVARADGSLVRFGLFEKLLVAALAKLANFVPDGGIWLNTQRPEWNDANNALAGPGLSMVTLFHLRRYLDTVGDLVERSGIETVTLSGSVADWLADVVAVLEAHRPSAMDDHERRSVVDALGESASRHGHRTASHTAYETLSVGVEQIHRLRVVACAHLDRAIVSSRRPDGLHHSYNRISFPDDTSSRVDHLGPMLEGQVAAISSGALDHHAVLAIVDALYASGIHRPDLDTFMLYPVSHPPGFLDRNVVPEDAVARLEAVSAAAGATDSLVALREVFVQDGEGRLSFRPEMVNAAALSDALERVGVHGADAVVILDLYEEVFAHASFTGRSGSMYGYEGIGSVYWHMVAKLLLAVQETYWHAVDHEAPADVIDGLAVAYRRIRSGFGFRMDPTTFGAIPTDCYSHSPAHAGAQQPGMTGQVKEEILTRLGELGFRVVEGCARLDPGLLDTDELLPSGPDGPQPAHFSVCAVPQTIVIGPVDSVTVTMADGTVERRAGLALTRERSRDVFGRTGMINRVEWTVGYT